MEERKISIDLAAANFAENLVKLCNGSGLPICVMRLTLEKMSKEFYQIEQQRVEAEKASIIEQNNKKTTEKEISHHESS